MQRTWYDEPTKRKIRSRFNSHDKLIGKGQPHRAVSAEREYVRLTNWYMKQIKTVLEEELPKLSSQYQEEYEDFKAVHQDGLFDFSGWVNKFFSGIMDKINSMDLTGQLLKGMQKAGIITKNVEIKEWRDMVHRTLGLDLSTDYYKGDMFDDLLSGWVDDNVGLIVTIPQDMLDRMKELVIDAYNNGTLPKDLSRQIQEAYGISKSHANLIARDQLSKLSGQIAEMEHKDAGVTKYEWSNSGDARVRDCHKEGEYGFHGKIYSYDNPPEAWHYNSDMVRVYDGRFCNPGQDFQCRCVAIPVFEEDKLNLPLADSGATD